MVRLRGKSAAVTGRDTATPQAGFGEVFLAHSDASERIGATAALTIVSAVKRAVLEWHFTGYIIPFLPRFVGRFCRGSLRWRISCTKHPPSPRLWRTSQAPGTAAQPRKCGLLRVWPGAQEELQVGPAAIGNFVEEPVATIVATVDVHHLVRVLRMLQLPLDSGLER